jgi:hypothetical protein
MINAQLKEDKNPIASNYSNITIRDDNLNVLFDRIFKSSNQAYKAIDAYVQKRFVRIHLNCTAKNCKITNDVCHYTWAYNNWRLCMIGPELKYRRYFKMNDRSGLKEFSVVGPYKNELYRLYIQALSNAEQFNLKDETLNNGNRMDRNGSRCELLPSKFL